MGIISDSYREFEFTEQDFQTIRAIIYQHAGIHLTEKKTDLVYSRLSRRLRFYGLKKFSDYIPMIKDSSSDEWQSFVNSLTTNLTSFFRESHHFPILSDYIKGNRYQPISVWCSASSTGEEPYSIAMTIADTFNSLAPKAKILATDLDTSVLTTASNGIYNRDRVKDLSNDLLRKYFLKGKGQQTDKVRVKKEIRNLIKFQQLNLLDESWPINEQFDIMFCRNVMIYFDKQTQYKILEKFAPLLKPNGLLFVGHSESFPEATHNFKLREKTVYVRTLGLSS